jgi:hypothetical protein
LSSCQTNNEQVQFASGKTVDLGASDTESLNKRPLLAQPGTTLLGLSAITCVGVKGDIYKSVDTPDDSGVIIRLGLIHSPEEIPDELFQDPDWDREEVPLALRTLWHPSAASVPAPNNAFNTGPNNRNTCPIWVHPNLNMERYIKTWEDTQPEIPIAFLSHHVLVWAKDADELKQVKRISVLREVRQHYRENHENTGRFIIGIRVEYRKSYKEPPRMIGRSRLPSRYADADANT